MGRRENIRQQYEAWPYPYFPFFASVRRLDTWQLNLDYLWDRCGSGPAPEHGRIWIAGCGTFQPYTIGLANPGAEICATDNSMRSLRQARRRCRWHGMDQQQFARVDLNDESTWPDGPFDYIECFGVLMNLDDPQRTLRAMAARLSERGVLRIMVYPQFSRQRVFQIQRVAGLLGLDYRDAKHPGLLRRIMTGLPTEHPLRFGFETYPDSANDAGIVDGFLHAGDRGFTGRELGELIQAAELEPAFWFHRPWGQPEIMAPTLGLDRLSPTELLHYLDTWQELRTNLIVCLRRKDARQLANSKGPSRLHPLLDPSIPVPWTSKLRILGHRRFGAALQSRTDAGTPRWSAKELAILIRAARGEPIAAGEHATVKRGHDHGLLLGGGHEATQPSPNTARLIPRPDPLFLGRHVPNPLYQHLFEAWPAGLEACRREIERWDANADPLEPAGHFGLTPYGTWLAKESAITSYLHYPPTRRVARYQDLRYQQEAGGRIAVRDYLAQFPDLPVHRRSDAEERELWILLGSHSHLFLDAEGDSAQVTQTPSTVGRELVK